MRLHGLGIPGALDTIAQTIQQVEGYYPGSLAYRNNNPGNLIYTSYYAQNYGAIPGDGGYSKFPDYDTGYAAMIHQIQVDSGRGDSIYDLTYSWLGSGQGGDATAYASSIADALGVTIDAKVQPLIADDLGGSNVLPPTPILTAGVGAGASSSALLVVGAALVGFLILSR